MLSLRWASRCAAAVPAVHGLVRQRGYHDYGGGRGGSLAPQGTAGHYSPQRPYQRTQREGHTPREGHGQGYSASRQRSPVPSSSSTAAATSAPSSTHHSASHAPAPYRRSQPPHPHEASADRAAAAAATATAAAARPTFWSQPVREVPVGALKRQHLLARAQDKKSRFLVRSRIREDGVVSNFFAVGFPPAEPPAPPGTPPKPGTHVYVYEVYVTRQWAPSTAQTRQGAPQKSAPRARSPPPQRTAATAAPDTGSTERRVPPGRAWRAVERFLRHRYSGASAAALPPLVQVNNNLYAAAPLPAEALVLPRTYLDLGWTVAELRLQRRCRFAELPPGELQMLMNKIVPEVVHTAHREHATCVNPATGVLEMVREKTGKVLCTMQAVSVGGLRVYRGVLVQAVFVDAAAADTTASRTSAETAANPTAAAASAGASRSAGTEHPPCPVTSRCLGDAAVGLRSAAAAPIRFEVLAFLRAFVYRGTEAESYRIRDGSGVYLASLWAPATPRALTIGAVYDAAPVRIREFAERGNARLIEFLPETELTLVAAAAGVTAAQRSSGARGPAPSASSASTTARLPGQLSLKIDTKGTLASEVSLWEEVLQHFGPGPYDEAAQQRIRKSVDGVPIVLSYSLRQGVVRDVRFDTDALLAAATATRALPGADAVVKPSSGAHAMQGHGATKSAVDAAAVVTRGASSDTAGSLLCVREPRLRALLPHLDSMQPCAILTDHTVVPLQVLHCCYDPRIRGWQDIGVSVLSLMPKERSELLVNIQGLLETGLRRWGLTLEREALRTKALSLLPAPMKSIAPSPPPHQRGGSASAAAASDFPTTMLIIGVAGPRCTAEQVRRTTLTAQHIGQYFRTPLVTCVADESAAVQYVHDQLISPATAPGARPSLKDPNASVMLVTSEPDTRATRWLQVECMCRGAHFIAVAPVANPKRLNLMASQLRRRIATHFERDPLRGIDLRAEVPALGQRTVLIVGVDSCHTNTHSIGCIVGILSTPVGNHVLSYFWRHDARGREAQHVAKHFRGVLAGAVALAGRVDEVVVFQDGDVFSELVGVKDELLAQMPQCGLTFMCLHKRCNVRFMHASPTSGGNKECDAEGGGGGGTDDGADNSDDDGGERYGEDGFSGAGRFHNVVKGVVVPALSTVPLDNALAAPSFYLQAHESAMSTARAVAYTVHHVSPSLDVADVQQMANVMANVMAPQATKLPMSTRCAHRLAARAERLLDAVPQLTAEMIPAPLSHRLWYL